MSFSLNELFLLISGSDNQLNKDEKFNLTGNETRRVIRKYEQADIEFANAYFSRGFNKTSLGAYDECAKNIFDLSFNAFDTLLHAWLSELPIEKDIISYGKNIYAILKMDRDIEEKRKIANLKVNNRVDSDTKIMLNASYKVFRELDRLMGLLRFNPNSEGEFIAKCSPDHFTLPALGEYLTSRFGETAWTVIDEKRNLRLSRKPGGKFRTSFYDIDSARSDLNPRDDEWEELWKHYHKTINNEDRDNPDLQRQFMPKRYWQYLPEIEQ
ncbi:MAG: TIGR03915 family putative DNA repair protein [Treponema sp.]|nr:TIGR03915 family putative DNA repair protein [Treponema sp.]